MKFRARYKSTRLIHFVVSAILLVFLSGCEQSDFIPSDLGAQCKRKAIKSGYGKCSISKGRQNSYGVWIMKLNCSRGVASCMNNTSDGGSISEWTSTSEFLYKQQ